MNESERSKQIGSEWVISDANHIFDTRQIFEFELTFHSERPNNKMCVII